MICVNLPIRMISLKLPSHIRYKLPFLNPDDMRWCGLKLFFAPTNRIGSEPITRSIVAHDGRYISCSFHPKTSSSLRRSPSSLSTYISVQRPRDIFDRHNICHYTPWQMLNLVKLPFLAREVSVSDQNIGSKFMLTCILGKSSLTVQFVENHFVESYYPTIENTFSKQIKIKNQEYMTEIIDTAGQV